MGGRGARRGGKGGGGGAPRGGGGGGERRTKANATNANARGAIQAHQTEHLRSGPRLITEGFKCKTRAAGDQPAPPGHSGVLFDTVELRFGTRHGHILAHLGPPENSNSNNFFTPGTPQDAAMGGWGGGTDERTDERTLGIHMYIR